MTKCDEGNHDWKRHLDGTMTCRMCTIHLPAGEWAGAAFQASLHRAVRGIDLLEEEATARTLVRAGLQRTLDGKHRGQAQLQEDA